MSWSLTIGRFGATTLRVHLTFFLLVAWIGVSAWLKGGAPAARDSVLFVALLFGCVVLHEFGHILMARRFGIETPDVILLPIGGVSLMPRMPEKPAQEFAVAIAGPTVNIVIAFLLYLLLGSIHPEHLAQIDNPHISLLARLAAVNIFLVVFNLIPAFPMDGGRILRALLTMKLGKARATQLAASIGKAFAFALGFLGLFGNPLLIFIAIFVYMAAEGEAQMTAFHEATHGLSVADAMETRFNAIPINANLAAAIEMLLATAQHEFPVIDAFGRPVGLLVREDILLALNDHSREAAINTFMRVPVETVQSTTPLEAVLDRLLVPQAADLVVTNPDGVLVGLLTRQNLTEMMIIKSMRPDWRFDRA
ncbi:site-2 protease family protein [Beijerinckia indica]|uniref:Zinc metalloprotease n=1 Tax=Beijerinckia indica subsp. indica (strain ATCC 9039 / DSM 1715 / NCIMB 8712) TaxID=395963 RepID=B2IF01_BEII9|nr:site-2 protease family protein [Beijerinckia indica]ACB94192.1 peptidase M50 [Beijerinckia indica subsp. indica ATCC 9039]